MIAAPGMPKAPDYFPVVERGIVQPIREAFDTQLRRGLTKPPSARWTVFEAERLRKLLQDYRHDIYRIHRSAIAGDRIATREHIGWLITSFPARFFAALRVASKRKGMASFAELEALAREVNIDQPCVEPVRPKLLEKYGKTRWALVPDTMRRCSQIILRDALCAANLESPFEYSRRGLGPGAACGAIMRAVRKGYTHWLIVDIADFYPSVKPKHFAWMPVKQRFIRNATFIPCEAPTTGVPLSCSSQDIANIEAARQGLSLGSMVSPQIAGALTGRIIQDLPGDLERVSYVDDIALGARSQGEILTVEDALKERLSSLDAGPLKLKFATHFSAEHQIQFMNFRIRPGYLDCDDLRISPSAAAFKRFRHAIRWKHGAGATEPELLQYAQRWATGVSWVRPGIREEHRDYIRDFLLLTVYDTLGW